MCLAGEPVCQSSFTFQATAVIAIREYASSGLALENIITNALKAIDPKAGPLLPDNWIQKSMNS